MYKVNWTFVRLQWDPDDFINKKTENINYNTLEILNSRNPSQTSCPGLSKFFHSADNLANYNITWHYMNYKNQDIYQRIL